MPGAPHDEPDSPRWVRSISAALEIAWWWGAAVGVWLLTLSSVSTPELIAAGICGLPCALAARAARRSTGGRWRPLPRWGAWIGPLLVAVPADAARLLAVTVRRLATGEIPGELHEIRLPAGEPPEVRAARHALAVLAVSATPGTFVADSDPEKDTIVIHTLVSGPPRMEKVVAR